jgi:hypothetical protein
MSLSQPRNRAVAGRQGFRVALHTIGGQGWMDDRLMRERV